MTKSTVQQFSTDLNSVTCAASTAVRATGLPRALFFAVLFQIAAVLGLLSIWALY